MLNNALPRELPCGLGKTLGRPPGAEDRRRGELGLINKRLGELLECTRKGLGARGGESVDWREVRTGGANGGTTVARGGCACT
jgi:hypothetical protein